MKPLATTPPTQKKIRSIRGPVRTKLGAATTRRREITPEEFAAATAKLGPKGQAALKVFADFEKAHPGYGEWAWPRLKAAMERSNGRTRKTFAD